MVRKQTFGEFFRRRRTTLGLGLREFCRVHHFAPSSVSRIENSKLPPPKKPALLTSYAKALRLAEGSDDFTTFFDLAASETGVLPSELMGRKEVTARLPRVLDDLRGSARGREAHSTGESRVLAANLETWALTDDGKERLPQLVRRLVHATVDDADRVDFAAVQRRGWDGIVQTPRGNAFVPSGVSLWELSASADPRNTAERNLAKRTPRSLGFDPGEAAFVFVTPQKWEGKRDWCLAKRERGLWQDIKAYDSDDLEQWLEQAPAVDIWLATLLGLRPPGVADLRDHWENLTASLTRPLPPDVFLVSRDSAVEQVTAWLGGPPDCLAFETPSPGEVIDFLAAHVRRLDETAADAIEARLVVVSDAEAWRGLSLSRNRLVLIAAPALPLDRELVAEAVRRGHHALLCSNRFAGAQTRCAVLPRPYRYDLEKALEASGLSDQLAERYAREARGSLSVLKRALARFPATAHPAWSDAHQLVPLLLAGSWDDACQADASALSSLARRPYDEVSEVAERWRAGEDPPVMRALTHWSLTSREDSWLRLRHLVTTPDLDAFEKVALDVLREADPQWELPIGERWLAGLDRKTPRYSPQLRRGITETIALLGAMPDGLPQHPTDPQGRATLLVRRFLGENVTWQRWAALSPLLPLLAEAAPDEFLNAAEANRDHVLRLLQEEGTALFGSSPHTGLLWALETLAWHPDYLPRAALMLAHLAQNDPARDRPEGRLANRPGRSLRHILLPWIQQTAACVEERIRVLDLLIERFPDVGFALMLGLLPQMHDHSLPVCRPAWRDWALAVPRRVSSADYWRQVSACADRLLAHVGTDPTRWASLLDRADDFPPGQLDGLIGELARLGGQPLDADSRHTLHETLRKTVAKHRQFADAKWALPAEVTDRLDAARAQFEPDDPVRRHAWLFGFRPDLPDLPRDAPYKERDAVVAELRRRALEDTLAAGGLPLVVRLAELADHPAAIGFLLGLHQLVNTDTGILPDLVLAEGKSARLLADGYVCGCFRRGSWGWVDALPLAEWSPDHAAALAVGLPPERRTWDLVERLGLQASEHYWQRVAGVDPEATPEDLSFALSMLLRHGRPRCAIETLALCLHGSPDGDTSLIADVLGVASQTEPTEHDDPDHTGMLPFGIEQLFQRIESDPGFDQQALARLEWAYLPVLHRDGQTKALHQHLADDPAFFAEVLAYVYGSSDAAEDETRTPTDQERARARNAHALLRSWTRIPGTLPDGTAVDPEVLLDWVRRARELCAASGRLAVCDLTIGEVLARARHDPDGTWPPLAVRQAIEQTEGEELGRGFRVGTMNLRGVHSRSLTEGGAQERELARKYRQYAEACRTWPRTAAVLRAVAEDYERDARRADEEVEDRM